MSSIRDARPGSLGRRAPIVAIAAVALLTAACGSGVPAVSPAPTASTPSTSGDGPLPATSADVGGTTWVALPMGNFTSVDTTFWQLLDRSAAGWAEVTPPGVATNGGLLVSPTGAGTATVAFGTSGHLLFTPLARTVDGGATWSQGTLTDPTGTAAYRIATGPDAIAAPPPPAASGPGTGATPAASPATTVAVTVGARGRVLEDRGGLSAWVTVASVGSLRGVARATGCRLTGLASAGVGPTGAAEVGGRCAGGRHVPLFVDAGGRWTDVGPLLPDGTTGPVEVLTVAPAGTTSTGTGLVVRTGSAGGTTLWWIVGTAAPGGTPAGGGSGPAPSWSVSAPLRIGTDVLASLGRGPGGAPVVETTDGSGRATAHLSTGSSWTGLAPLPAGTRSVAVLPDGAPEALVVHGSVLTVESPASGGWSVDSMLRVPIDYGSSS